MALYSHQQQACGLSVVSSPTVIFPGSCAATAAIGRQQAPWLFACPCKIERDKPMRGGAAPVVSIFRIQEKQNVDLRIWFVKLITIRLFLNHSSLNLTVVWLWIHRWKPYHILGNKLLAALRNGTDLTVYCGVVIEALKSVFLPPRDLFWRFRLRQ